MYLLFSLLFLLFLYFKLILPLNYWHSRGIPQVFPLLRFTKSLFSISNESISHIFHSMYSNNPHLRYFGTFISTHPTLFLRDISLIKQITIKDSEYFSDRMNLLNNTNSTSDPLLSLTLFTLTGQSWKQMRSVLSPAFTSSKIKGMYPLICETAEKFCKHLEEEVMKSEVFEIEIKKLFEQFANDVVVKGYFGIEIDSLKNEENEFLQVGRMFMRPSWWTVARGTLFLIFPRLFEFFGLSVVPVEISKVFLETITKARETSNSERPNLMQLLIQAKKEKLNRNNTEKVRETGFAAVEEYESLNACPAQPSIEISTKIIAGLALSLYLPGVSTTSSFLEFFAYELAINPKVQAKLHIEIKECEEISYETLTKMRYLDQTVCEVLRKWSIAYVTTRICTKDYVIEPERAGERRVLIEKGCAVLVPIFALHSDPDFFPEPEKFIPERFSDEKKIKGFIPFGIGPRNCVASRFALLVVKVMIVHFFKKFEVVPVKKTQIPLKLASRLLVETKRDVCLDSSQKALNKF